LTSKEKPTIKLPDFGKIKDDVIISNPEVKELNEDNLSEDVENIIEKFVKDYRKPSRPFLEYDRKKHKYELNPKYDIDKILDDVIKNR